MKLPKDIERQIRHQCFPGCRSEEEAAASRKKAHRDEQQGRDRLFDAMCEAHGLSLPVHEYEFARELGRKWRFDYCWPDFNLAVEKVGGVWVAGHHSRGRSQIDDMERRNHAALLGWFVLEFTPGQFDSGEAFSFIKRVIDGGETV